MTSTDQAFPLTTAPVPDQIDVLRALAWRFVRRSTQSVLPLLGILWGMPTLLYFMVRMVDAATIRELAADDVSLKRLFFLLSMIAVPGLPLAELIKVRRLYTLPLTTRQIVHDQLGIGLATVTTVHLLTVVYYRAAFGATLPVVGPLLFLIPGLLMAAGLASFLVNARLWKIPVAFVVVVYFATQGGMRFNNPALTRPGSAWFTPSLREMLVLVTAAVVGYVITRHAAVRDRQGETRPWADVVELWHRLVAWLDTRRGSQTAATRESFFPSALAVHRSYEWQTRGLVVPMIAVVGGLLSLIGAWFHPADWVRGYVLAIPGLLFFGMTFSGVFAGMMHEGKSTGTMDVYRATRPLTDTQLATIALKNALRSTVVGLLITLGYALLVTAFAYVCGEQPLRAWSEYRLESQSIFGTAFLGYVVIIVTSAMQGWALLGFNLSCVATGRHWLYVTLWVVVIGGFFVPIVLANNLTEAQMQFVYWCAAMLLAFTAGVGTIAGYRAASARGLIPPARCVVGGVMWVAATAFLLVAFPGLRTHSAGPPAAIGLGALVALPLASAPLAVWWNRHR